MPVTDLSGDDWLQSLMANYGANSPYGASGYPDNLPPRPYGPPGGGLIGYPGATPGAPSMGYPAMGQPPAPGPAQGLSLSSPQGNLLQRFGYAGAGAQPPLPSLNSLLHPAAPDWLKRFGAAIGAGGAQSGDPYATTVTGLPPMPSFGGASAAPPLRPGAANSLPLAWGNPTSQDYRNWLSAQLANPSPPAATATAPPAKRTDAAYGPYDDPNAPAPIGDYVSRVGNYPSWPTTAARPVVGSPGPSIANAPLPPRRPSSFGGQTPGVGAPQGQPSQTPRPPKSSNRFGTVQYQVPGAGVGPLSRSPIYTALNLFGGR